MVNFIFELLNIYFLRVEIFPRSWIDIIGNGNKDETKKSLNEYAHKLGNLTLSTYNSNLSNRSFQTKQNLEKRMVSNNELKIGYKNGLGLKKFEFELNDKGLKLADS